MADAVLDAGLKESVGNLNTKALDRPGLAAFNGVSSDQIDNALITQSKILQAHLAAMDEIHNRRMTNLIDRQAAWNGTAGIGKAINQDTAEQARADVFGLTADATAQQSQSVNASLAQMQAGFNSQLTQLTQAYNGLVQVQAQNNVLIAALTEMIAKVAGSTPPISITNSMPESAKPA